MARLMSCTLTEQAVVDRTKTVTRRTGWLMLRPGDRLTLCRKVMGRRKGDPLVRLAEVEVTSVRRERLSAITAADVGREGVGWEMFGLDRPPSPAEWVAWFSAEQRVDSDAYVTRIEWRYLEDD
jgi:hypothetical protein